MKKLVLLTLCLIVVFTSFSQGDSTEIVSLEPDTVITDSMGVPTHFGWRVTDQVPIMAAHIVRSEKSLGIEAAQDSASYICDSIIDTQKVSIQSLNFQLDNRESKLDNQKIIIYGKNGEIKGLKLEIRWLKFKVVAYPLVSAFSAGLISYGLLKPK